MRTDGAPWWVGRVVGSSIRRCAALPSPEASRDGSPGLAGGPLESAGDFYFVAVVRRISSTVYRYNPRAPIINPTKGAAFDRLDLDA